MSYSPAVETPVSAFTLDPKSSNYQHWSGFPSIPFYTNIPAANQQKLISVPGSEDTDAVQNISPPTSNTSMKLLSTSPLISGSAGAGGIGLFNQIMLNLRSNTSVPPTIGPVSGSSGVTTVSPLIPEINIAEKLYLRQPTAANFDPNQQPSVVSDQNNQVIVNNDYNFKFSKSPFEIIDDMNSGIITSQAVEKLVESQRKKKYQDNKKFIISQNYENQLSSELTESFNNKNMADLNQNINSPYLNGKQLNMNGTVKISDNVDQLNPQFEYLSLSQQILYLELQDYGLQLQSQEIDKFIKKQLFRHQQLRCQQNGLIVSNSIDYSVDSDQDELDITSSDNDSVTESIEIENKVGNMFTEYNASFMGKNKNTEQETRRRGFSMTFAFQSTNILDLDTRNKESEDFSNVIPLKLDPLLFKSHVSISISIYYNTAIILIIHLFICRTITSF